MVITWHRKQRNWIGQNSSSGLTSETDLRKNSSSQNYVSTYKTLSFTKLLLPFESELWAFIFDLSNFKEQ